MPGKKDLTVRDLKTADTRFGELSPQTREALLELTNQHQLSIAAGDLVLLNGN